MSLVVGRWLVVTRVHCGLTVHPRPISSASVSSDLKALYKSVIIPHVW